MICVVEQGNTKNNWGDILNPYIYENLSDTKTYKIVKNAGHLKVQTYVICGSILRLANNLSHVWGAGFISSSDTITGIWNVKKKKSIYKPKIHCVRGKLTRNKLLNEDIYCPEIYGDAAMIFPYLYNPIVEKKYMYGIIPHYVDISIILKNRSIVDNKNVKIIDICVKNGDIFNVVDDVASCDIIFSSSLHGLILGDMYSRQRKSYHLKISNKLDGGNFKFEDYYSSINRKYENIELDDLADALNNNIHLQKWYNYKKEFDYDIFIDSCPFMDKNKKHDIKIFFKNYKFGN